MGKRREFIEEGAEIINTTPHKRHKRHKHKKPQKPKTPINNDSDGSLDISSESENINQKIKVKIEVPVSAADKLKAQSVKMSDKVPATPGISPKVVKKKRKRDSGTSSEEERWLDAIESGKLEEVDDELKKIKPKDPKLMTARQRAMYERGSDKDAIPGEALMALPSGYKEKVMTAEAIQKAALKSQKRKQMADEKREKDKKKTMERLLKKQDSKATKVVRGRTNRQQVPLISYKNNKDGIILTFPIEMPCPLLKKEAIEPPKVVLCAIDDCKNPKKYTCSKTNTPLCSLKCYKRNFELLRKIII